MDALSEIHLGEHIRVVRSEVVIGAASGVVVRSNQDRVYLAFGPPDNGRVTLAQETTAVAGQGVVLDSDDDQYIMWVHRHGDIVQKEWTGIGVGGGDVSTASWEEFATATNAVASAIRAAEADRIHRVGGVFASYETTGTSGQVVSSLAGASFLEENFTDNMGRSLFPLVESTANTTIRSDLTAGGAGVVGNTTIIGDTIFADSATRQITVWQGILPGYGLHK